MKTTELVVPVGNRAIVFASNRSEDVALVAVGNESVSLRAGETAIVDGDHIVAPRRILDERLRKLTAKLADLNRT